MGFQQLRGQASLCPYGRTRFDEQNGAVFFDGVNPELILMTINGDVSANSIVLPDFGSGTIHLADLANGTITVAGASGDIRTVPVGTGGGQAGGYLAP